MPAAQALTTLTALRAQADAKKEKKRQAAEKKKPEAGKKGKKKQCVASSTTCDKSWGCAKCKVGAGDKTD